MDVIGVVLLALGIVLYVEFNCSWKGAWKIPAALYSVGIGIILIWSEHRWVFSWLMN